MQDLADECFIPLTEEEESEVSKALSNSNRYHTFILHLKSTYVMFYLFITHLVTGEKYW